MKISTQKLENIKLQITFPFANKNDENEITIYQKTIEEVMKLFAEERFYISFNRNNKGIACIKSIVDFIYSLDENNRKNLTYPSLELFSNEEIFQNDFVCITSCKKLNVTLNDISNNQYDLLNRYFRTPPVRLKDLIITISCDIEYFLV